MNKNKISTEGIRSWWHGLWMDDSCSLTEFNELLDKKDSGGGYLSKEKEKALNKQLQIIEERLRKGITPIAAAYIDELEKTGGSYKKRNNRILDSVSTTMKIVKSMLNDTPRKSGFLDGVVTTKLTEDTSILRLYLSVAEMLFDSTYEKMFQAAYKSYSDKSGSTAAAVAFYEYISLIYFVENMTVIIGPMLFDVNMAFFEGSHKHRKEGGGKITGPGVSGGYAEINGVTFTNSLEEKLTRHYPSFFNTGVKGALIIFKRYNKNGGNAYANYNKARLAEKQGDSASKEVATIFVVLGALTAVFLAPALARYFLGAIRGIVYNMGCMKVDVSISLIEQSYVLAVNVNELKEKLKKLDPDSKEYKALKKTIDAQNKWIDRMVAKAQKLSDTDIRDLNEIRTKDSDDEKSIEEAADDGNDGNTKGDDDPFDI